MNKIKEAIQPNGAIMASPTMVEPNPAYRFHWVRDAALTMDLFVDEAITTAVTREERRPFVQLFERYNNFSRSLQLHPPFSPPTFRDKENKVVSIDPKEWFGEPKWNLNGEPFDRPWTRPQNDGPALRALSLTKFARHLLHTYYPHEVFISTNTTTVISADLAYVVSQWQRPSYEIWEEVKGLHFYTLMVQRAALKEAISLYERLDDQKTAEFYEKTIIPQMERELHTFWDANRRLIKVTKKYVDGLAYKHSDLDMQVILAALHAGTDIDDFYHPAHPRVHSTLMKLINKFSHIYPINHGKESIVPVMGRYPEDQYDGYKAFKNGGNPWILLTLAVAETCYRTRTYWQRHGEIRVVQENQEFLSYIVPSKSRHFYLKMRIHEEQPLFQEVLDGLLKKGDQFMQRVQQLTTAQSFHFSEQWNRNTGEQQGAEDLTWSYVAFVTAFHSRQQAL